MNKNSPHRKTSPKSKSNKSVGSSLSPYKFYKSSPKLITQKDILLSEIIPYLSIDDIKSLRLVSESYGKNKPIQELLQQQIKKDLEFLSDWIYDKTEVRYTINELKNLEKLDLSDNRLTEIPKEFIQLNLKELDLSSNELEKIPELKNNLEKLDLSDNIFKDIPKEIFQLKNLKELDLSINQLKKIPKEISQLKKNLQVLDLSYNKLTEIHKNLFKLKNLQVLDLSNNKLTEIPKELNKLTNIKHIDLYNNKLKKIPKELDKYQISNMDRLLNL